MRGKIIKGIAGFYYVDTAESGVYECRARGIFRKQKIKPLVGDDAEIEILDEAEKEGNLSAVLPRSNELIRPAAANVGQALLLFAAADPEPNFLLLDRFLIAMEIRHIPALLCFNKKDLVTDEKMQEIRKIYADCGYPVCFISIRNGEGLQELLLHLQGKTTIIAGPSGAGKSSLTNACQDSVHMETGEISKKLMRGKNTTRHAELIPAGENTYLMDTPGFSFFETEGIAKEGLRDCYEEFRPYQEKCRFDSCAHIREPDCAVKEALSEGKISLTRYENYCTIYENLKEQEKRRY